MIADLDTGVRYDHPDILALAATLLAVAIYHTFNYDREYRISADHVARAEAERTQLLAAGN